MVAVIGAGPVGIEAALSCKAMGHDVTVYEAGSVGAHLRRFGHVPLFTPFAMNSTREGRGRLRAHGIALPDGDAMITGLELVERYLEPLSRIPELAPSIREHAVVSHVGRQGVDKSGGIVATGDTRRTGAPFLIRVEDAKGVRFERADAVLDASGIYGSPRATGPCGLPAPGEEGLGDRLERHIPAILGAARPRYAGARVLLLGSGHSAATALVDLAALASEGDVGSVTWVLRPADRDTVFEEIPDDPLPARRRLAARANEIARSATWLRKSPGAVVRSYATAGRSVMATLENTDGGGSHAVEVDRVLALCGYRPDTELYRELQIHLCYATEAPMALASALLAARAADPGRGGDCLKQTTHGPETLRTTEPDFYVLGAKSYGRGPGFLLRTGYEQVREVAALFPVCAAPGAG